MNNDPEAETQVKARRLEKDLNEYYDKAVQVLVSGDEVIYIHNISTDKIVLHNVWIKKGAGNNLDIFINGLDKTFQAKSSLSQEIEELVGDVSIEDMQVVEISVKPDIIHGKVLQTGKEFIEVEGYGKLS